MSMHLRHGSADDALAISELVQAGFLEYIAPDWEPSAQRSFLADTEADKLAPKLSEAAVCLVWEQAGQVLGVIFLPRPTLVQLLFVAPGHLRKGIARALWSAVRAHLDEKHPEVTTVELNSSPYALAAYKALGFFPISQPFRRKGAAATRMACWLPGKALEQGRHTEGDLVMSSAIAEGTTEVLEAFADAWNRHDVDALMSFMSVDCVFEASAGSEISGTRYVGREAVRASYAEVWAALPDAHWGNARHFVCGDRGVSEWTFTGTRADGTFVEVHGCDLFTFRDGKIALKNSYRKNRPPLRPLER